MDKIKLRNRTFKFLGNFGNGIKTKFSNICSKTGMYSVPKELFQKRCPRKNRALISWEAVVKNNITLEQLETFEGGVVVEFINNDFFNCENQKNELFNILKQRIGSDENVSSIISIRSENGTSSSAVQRLAFKNLINDTKIIYKDKEIIINEDNYKDYAIKQDIKRKGQGNETWSGFLFISIKGGQQDKIETHQGEELTLFNPACEYASEDVCYDIDLVMSYFALKSIKRDELIEENIKLLNEYDFLVNELERSLESIYYDNESYSGNLLDFAKNHYSLSLKPGQLTDPIQLTRIEIDKFNISSREENSIDFTHEEAVIYEKYYWDNCKKCLLSPARPTNVFWSYHLSNMMQQNYDLINYFDYEKERFENRQKLINNINEKLDL